MRTRRQALLGLAMLAIPGAALAETAPKPRPPARPVPAGKPSGRKAEKPPAGPRPKAGAAPAGKPPAARGRPAAAPAVRAEAEPRPRGPARVRDDGPALRPVDRELVQGWLAANPEWRPGGKAQPLAEGRPLPPGPRQALPPGLAVLLPYFPGYRYAAAGSDLVLYAAGTEVVASILAGALSR